MNFKGYLETLLPDGMLLVEIVFRMSVRQPLHEAVVVLVVQPSTQVEKLAHQARPPHHGKVQQPPSVTVERVTIFVAEDGAVRPQGELLEVAMYRVWHPHIHEAPYRHAHHPVAILMLVCHKGHAAKPVHTIHPLEKDPPLCHHIACPCLRQFPSEAAQSLHPAMRHSIVEAVASHKDLPRQPPIPHASHQSRKQHHPLPYQKQPPSYPRSRHLGAHPRQGQPPRPRHNNPSNI